jgi:hypothetical protein
MAESGGSDRKRWSTRLAELGPTWITALTGLLVALTGAGFFVGRATVEASQAPPTTVTRTVTVTVPAPAPSTDTTATDIGSVPGVLNLSATKPAQSTFCNAPVPGSEQIGTTVYPNSVRTTCASGTIVYDVAGFTFFNAVMGTPNDANDVAGNTMVVTFFKDSNASEQLGPPLSVVVGQPQTVHLDMQGSTQLEIQLTATTNATHQQTDMDLVLGNATFSKS